MPNVNMDKTVWLRTQTDLLKYGFYETIPIIIGSWRGNVGGAHVVMTSL